MQTDNLRIVATHPLISPAVLEEELPQSGANAGFVATRRLLLELAESLSRA